MPQSFCRVPEQAATLHAYCVSNGRPRNAAALLQVSCSKALFRANNSSSGCGDATSGSSPWQPPGRLTDHARPEIKAVAQLPKALKTAWRGGVKKASKAALLVARQEGRDISTNNACVINDIGRHEDGKKIDVLFGSLI